MTENIEDDDDDPEFLLRIPCYALAKLPEMRVVNGHVAWSPTTEFFVAGNAEQRALAVFTDVYLAADAIVEGNQIGKAAIVTIRESRELAEIAHEVMRTSPGAPVRLWFDRKWLMDADTEWEK